MLLLPVCRILAAVLPFVARCSASDPDTLYDDSKLDLSKLVPDCAQTCVENFIKTHYTPQDCNTPSDVDCLCRTKTSSELTLGEAALSCVYALCPAKVVKSSKVYRVCDSVSGALPETHATITATTFGSTRPTMTDVATTTSTSTTSETTSQAVVAPATFTTVTTTSTTHGVSSLHPISSETRGPDTTDQSTAGSTTTSSSSQEEEEKQNVSSATVIGVSVTSGVAGSFIIGVAVIFLCKRWRQKNQAHSDASPSEQDFEIGGTMTEPPGFSQNSSRRSSPSPGPIPGLGLPAVSAGTHPEMSESPREFHPTSQYPPQFASIADVPRPQQPRRHERIGFAVSSESDWEGSPRTLTPQHTPAAAMSDQDAGLCPKPLKWTVRPVSGETLFEEDGLQPNAAARRPAPQMSESPTVMTGLPANPRALKNGFPARKFLRAPTQQHPGPRQTPVNSGERGLGPPLAYRNSTTSNSSSAPNYSSSSSDHASSNTHLTTPPFTGHGHILSGAPGGKPLPQPQSLTTSNPPGIVSRPRIVRRDDIKRVQIRGGTRPPNEIVAPYCPEDLWLKRKDTPTVSNRRSSTLPYPSEASPGTILYPSSPKKRPHDMPERVSPTSRNLTPSRRGEDLILRVD